MASLLAARHQGRLRAVCSERAVNNLLTLEWSSDIGSRFQSWRMMDKPAEFWRFPAETHELSRSGSPVHRRQRCEIILDWFSQHLECGRGR